MAERSYAVPVYRGWPERPYRVIGSLRFDDAYKFWDEGILQGAASHAKSKGGDAMIIRSGSEFGVGLTTGAANDPEVLKTSQTTALVIKWKSAIEVEQERAATEHFFKEFTTKHPDLGVKKDLVALAADYVVSLGIALDSPSASQKLGEVLTEVTAEKSKNSATWLFRGSVRSSGLTTSMSDVVYGLATVTSKGDNVTIVSTPGSKVELSFSGSSNDGRLSGQLGFSGGSTIISAKAEGVVVEEKISLTGNAQTAEGTFQGSFSFSR